ncbi:trehalase [Ceratobasidium sp. AG-Ba]|nr:trehalase [Ceratobasidium sp. AG-Ba]
MLLRLAAASCLLVVGVSGSASSDGPVGDTIVINDRQEYWEYARKYGMCQNFSDEANLKRPLKLPGDKVLAPFDACVAKNEFGEKLNDNSGEIFCKGPTIHLMADALNHRVDSKEFVDRASTLDGKSFNQQLGNLHSTGLAKDFTVEKFMNATKPYGALQLGEAGTELQYYNNTRFPNTPSFIHGIRPKAHRLRAWAKIVHHYWNNLDRTMKQVVGDYLIPGPGSDEHDRSKEEYSTTLIRLEHPFVIAGGRFREQYYWDSFFIMEGLLAADMSYLARTTLLNFMDQIKAYGFIPNGGRKYYLNRSQPPLFINMLHIYVESTKDYQILHEALPLAERELRWWYYNRSITVNHNEKNYTVFRYNVDATGPRPESYAEDWRDVWCHAKSAPSSSFERTKYSEFASGAESGWDYTARWMEDPFNQKDRKRHDQMLSLRVRDIIPVDLNSMIYRCHKLMEILYKEARNNESPFADAYGRRHALKAEELRKAILALHWDPKSMGFFDFVMKKGESDRNRTGYNHKFWSGASLVPYWAEIWPDELDSEKCESQEVKSKMMEAFSGVRDLLERYPGPLPATLVETEQQWDFPNSWAPLQYFAIQALQKIDERCVSETTTDEFKKTTTPHHHLGSGALPDSRTIAPKINYETSPSWRDVLLKTVAMRYMNAAFCNWQVRPLWNDQGKLPEDRVEMLLHDDPVKDKNLYKHPGKMFEKLNATSPTTAGGGGEYGVQTGFGWTNGVAIWIAKQYGAILDDPNCSSSGGGDVAGMEDSLLFQK